MNFKSIVATIFVAVNMVAINISFADNESYCSIVNKGDYYTTFVAVSSKHCYRYEGDFAVVRDYHSQRNDIWTAAILDKENPTDIYYVVYLQIEVDELFITLSDIKYRIPQGVTQEDNMIYSNSGNYQDSDSVCNDNFECKTAYLHVGHINDRFINSIERAHTRGELTDTDLLNFRATYNIGTADFRIQVGELLDTIRVAETINVNDYNADPAQR